MRESLVQKGRMTCPIIVVLTRRWVKRSYLNLDQRTEGVLRVYGCGSRVQGAVRRKL
jgi:hypothetical protein